jgi:hypothetical protein
VQEGRACLRSQTFLSPREDLILAAWDFDETYADENADEDVSSDDDDAFFEIEYRHDDREDIDLRMIDETPDDM